MTATQSTSYFKGFLLINSTGLSALSCPSHRKTVFINFLQRDDVNVHRRHSGTSPVVLLYSIHTLCDEM